MTDQRRRLTPTELYALSAYACVGAVVAFFGWGFGLLALALAFALGGVAREDRK